jgi:hypothetical protein
MDPRFLELGTSWRWAVSFTVLQLTSEKGPPCTHWVGGWVSPRTGLHNMEKWKFLTLPGHEYQSVASRYTNCPNNTLSPYYETPRYELSSRPSFLSVQIFFQAACCQTLIFDHEDVKRSWSSTGLHGVTSQEKCSFSSLLWEPQIHCSACMFLPSRSRNMFTSI